MICNPHITQACFLFDLCSIFFQVQYVDYRDRPGVEEITIEKPTSLPVKSMEVEVNVQDIHAQPASSWRKSPEKSPDYGLRSPDYGLKSPDYPVKTPESDKSRTSLGSSPTATISTTNQSTRNEVKREQSFLPPQEGASMSHDLLINQSEERLKSPVSPIAKGKSPVSPMEEKSQNLPQATSHHKYSTNAQHLPREYSDTNPVLQKDRSHDHLSRSRSKSPDLAKDAGIKTPEMSSSPMDVDSLSSSYDRHIDSFSPNENRLVSEVADMLSEGVSMDEQESKLGQRSRPRSRPSTDSMASSGDELGHGKMDISFHSEKDAVEDLVFMETGSKSKSSSMDSLDKGPGAPKSPKLEEEASHIRSKLITANRELNKTHDRGSTSPDVEPSMEIKTQKGVASSSEMEHASNSNVKISGVTVTESDLNSSAISTPKDKCEHKESESSFLMRSAPIETDNLVSAIPKRKRSVKDLLSRFEVLSQSPPSEEGGSTASSPPITVQDESEAKPRPPVFQKPKIVHLKTLSPTRPEASDFSKTPQQTFQSQVEKQSKVKTAELQTSPKIMEKKKQPLPATKPKPSCEDRPIRAAFTDDRQMRTDKAITNGQPSLMSRSLDQSMFAKNLDVSKTSELTIDTCESDVMTRSMELPSELANKDKPVKSVRKLGHSPSFKERLRMYEVQKNNDNTPRSVKTPPPINTNVIKTPPKQPSPVPVEKPYFEKPSMEKPLIQKQRSERASSEESSSSVKNLLGMFERQNSMRSDGSRSRSASREPEDIRTMKTEPISEVKVTEVKVKESAQRSQPDDTQPSASSQSDQSPSKEKKSVKNLLGMFERQNDPSSGEGAMSEDRNVRPPGAKKPWTAIV